MTLLEDMLTESGLDHDEMVEVVEALAPLADLVDDAPPPSTALAALFAGAASGMRTVRPWGTRTSAVAGVVVLALSSVGATGLSAAANTLPRPLQHQVSQFSRHYLPFHLPEPRGTSVHLPRLLGLSVDHARSASDQHQASRSQADRSAIAAPWDRREPEGAAPAPASTPQHERRPRTASGSPAGSAGHPSFAPSGKPVSKATPADEQDHGDANDQGNQGNSKGTSTNVRPHENAGQQGNDPGTRPHQDQGHGAGPDKSESSNTPPGEDQGDHSDKGKGGSGGSPSPTPPVPTLPLPELPPAPDTPSVGSQVTGG